MTEIPLESRWLPQPGDIKIIQKAVETISILISTRWFVSELITE